MDLQRARRKRGWSQKEAAARLGVSQPYLSMLESGRRPTPPRLLRKLSSLYRLPPTVLPLPDHLTPTDNQALAKDLANLGYPGFAAFGSARAHKNPAAVLLTALALEDLEERVFEALPWLLLHFDGLDTDWLLRQARLNNLQNRLGFAVKLARRVAASRPRYHEGVPGLRHLEEALERSRLAAEDTLSRVSLPETKRRRLRAARPPAAAHWNLLTDWQPEHLRYVG